MPRCTTRQSYAARVDKVVAYMAERLEHPVTLPQLAAVGHFSPFHFHRIYRGLMGETVADTLRRMRLHRAAVELLHGSAPLGGIARRCGYGSAAAFNRAFALAYGVPPGEFRRRKGLGVPALPVHRVRDREEMRMYEVRIEQRAPVAVAALAHRGPYHAIGAAFGKLGAWAAGRGVPEGRSFGLYYDDPESVAPAELRAEACVEVAADVPLDGGVRRLEIAGGRYAVLVHVGPYAELDRPYKWLFGEWLPDSGEEAADAPVVEEYLNDCRMLPPSQWRTAICLPLR
ncbi:AraC family transcriptional regulator [Vulcaniibacterium tengchongense]|uniref:AraC family transcriptional regulator n=1 Tax=Vulcaniibacterium tengchongense TaxID=1273429 RepID=A0A3N4W765_9GAMM|nr:AraC family transcriptional regulator [Vulcaniibacterium tengchongense]RPE81930.1 AraC family transcriptional regulator [Vulcaniibacterium tengchongense]